MSVTCASPDVVDHDGRPYLLVDLVHYLPLAFAREIGEIVPRSAQAFWDEVVRRWPCAAEQVADAVDREWCT